MIIINPKEERRAQQAGDAIFAIAMIAFGAFLCLFISSFFIINN